MAFLDNLNTAMSSPLMGMGIGLLSGGQPGGTFAGGAQQGLLNYQAMSQAQQQNQLQQLQMQQAQIAMEEAERKKATREQFIDASRNQFQQAGLLASPYDQSPAETFPGEEPIQGLMSGTNDPAAAAQMGLINAYPDEYAEAQIESMFPTTTGGGTRSKTPTMVMGPNGLEAWQLDSNGNPHRVDFGEGRAPVMPVSPLDMGGYVTSFNKYASGATGAPQVQGGAPATVGAPAVAQPQVPGVPPAMPAPTGTGGRAKTLPPQDTPQHAADIIQSEESEKARMGRLNAFETDMDAATAMLTGIDRTREELSHLSGITDSSSTGFGTFINAIPLTDARTWDQVKTTVQSQLGLEKMAELKSLSATGSTGFGALNERELDLLVKHLGALDQATGPAEIKRVITRIDNVLSGKSDRIRKKMGRQVEFYQKNRESLGDMGLSDEDIQQYWPTSQGTGKIVNYEDL